MSSRDIRGILEWRCETEYGDRAPLVINPIIYAEVSRLKVVAP
jgi:hypothetical protein